MKPLLIFSALLVIAFGGSVQAQTVRNSHFYVDDGSGKLIDIIAASLGANRQVTFPDPGANANVILSQSASGQTISGGLTVAGTVSLGSGLNSFSLPLTRGSSGDVLTSDGVGGSSWLAPTGSSAKYGYGYELATLADATVVGGADVPFSNNGPLSGITHTAGTTTFTVATTGTYEFCYDISHTAGVGAELAIAVNGTIDASTPIPLLTSTGMVKGVSMLSLTAGDVVTLRNNSATSLTLALAPSVGSQVTIKKVN